MLGARRHATVRACDRHTQRQKHKSVGTSGPLTSTKAGSTFQAADSCPRSAARLSALQGSEPAAAVRLSCTVILRGGVRRNKRQREMRAHLHTPHFG